MSGALVFHTAHTGALIHTHIILSPTQPQHLDLSVSYIPTAALGNGGVVRKLSHQPRPYPAATAPCSPYTTIGIVSGGKGPLFLAGVNFEHSVDAELVLVAGATNHVILGLQTEEAPVALSLNGTVNAVVFGTLGAFWNASQRVPAAVLAVRPDPIGKGAFDMAYRLYGVSVPAAESDAALVIDTKWVVPGGEGFQGAVGVFNSGR